MKPAAEVKADQLLTMPEVAARLGVSRATAYRHVADGSIKTVEAGRGKTRTKSRVRESELVRFMDEREQ